MLTRFLASAAILGLTAGMAAAEYKLTILHTNDIHSRIESINKYDSTCDAEDEAEGKCFGGVARLKTIVDSRRDALADQNVLLLDAGDPFQGSLFYTTYKGAAEAEFMEAIGYDVMAVGNHEFDDGPEGLASFIETVSFPVISGNLDLSSSAELNGKVENHVVLDIGGQKVGIISALATDTVETSSPGKDVVFQDEIESLKADVAALQDEGVNIIIALNHVGLAKDLEIAAQVPGLDLVVGGHSHTLLSNTQEGAAGSYPMMVGDVPVVQAYAYSKYLGEITLTFDDDGNLIAAEGEPILLDASVTPDADIAARVAEMGAPIEEMKQRVVANSGAAIQGDRSICRVQECEMGNLVADAMLARVADQGAQIAIANSGGLRASIDEGDVTMGEVLTVLPFQNTLSTFEITGQTVIDALENGVSQVEEVKGRFPQVAGLSFTWDPSVAPNEGRISEVMVAEGDGFVPIDPNKTYLVVTNNYVRNGGDGYSMFEGDDKNAYDFGPDLADVTAEYLAENAPYQPYLDGRIKQK
ncbi:MULTISPECIES: bifunctional UDP-sugar hydrolase/5'-nucleotidase [unclassified Ruegeria]|uniref:bifunctional metallophosphatase/5'-nucleotidase n=1 Tax=unclassified Ruegeria TaxID=2625375 RepID=UPI0014899A3D|nr:MULTISPECIES: bifunctional metallophosphatase/5'-nucleotidase [unclassified Ruegeria]NOD62782.1 multifunctional 2',3'-cyclic-nucleotide 2'-phosphodiesterase/5'-nucleotidase/3'-nucleotidase [Ruegeria sp. HKCCD6109]NOD77498.1 multifunctional 2',3'-cyclic-nucleotide 2'-phosphodiesterase/5'-nucleotidase/3'-nucleotidase [Ruegeria sp. HKCCD4332]NOD87942.1 multifunctional 2',3'-cyclic-nucleotide 2'-phosphodiesterase/5'-nucleotidase/3'-nucleotidase [Ruegeria sp. HKCCD4318]NOD92069.1 multifunctional 